MKEIINTHYNELLLLMIFICILGIIIMLIPLFLNQKKQTTKLTDREIKKTDNNINKEQIKKETFLLYKKYEIAKSKFDYNTLKEILTEELYKEEELKLKEIKENKQKLVATNIKQQEVKVLSIKKKDDIETINIYLYVSQYDYVIDNKKKVVRGTGDTEYQIEYRLTLERNKDKQFKISKKECTGKWIKNN